MTLVSRVSLRFSWIKTGLQISGLRCMLARCFRRCPLSLLITVCLTPQTDSVMQISKIPHLYTSYSLLIKLNLWLKEQSCSSFKNNSLASKMPCFRLGIVLQCDWFMYPCIIFYALKKYSEIEFTRLQKESRAQKIYKNLDVDYFKKNSAILNTRCDCYSPSFFPTSHFLLPFSFLAPPWCCLTPKWRDGEATLVFTPQLVLVARSLLSSSIYWVYYYYVKMFLIHLRYFKIFVWTHMWFFCVCLFVYCLLRTKVQFLPPILKHLKYDKM